MRNANQIRWNSPPVGDQAAQQRASKPLADLESQATTPEQKEHLKALQESFEKTDDEDKKVRDEADAATPDGFEAQPDGSFLCVPCTEHEGNPFIVKRRQDIGRHSAGGGHILSMEAFN